MSYSPAPGVDGGNEFIQKIIEATRCTITSLDIPLNGMAAQSRSDALLNGPDTALNFRDMLFFGCTV